MTLLLASKSKIVFKMGESERSLFFTVLDLYPRVTSAATLSSRSGKKPGLSKESSALLEEALSEQRAENKKQLKAFVAEPRRFEKADSGWRFSMTHAEAEWLLQILNDIRVGSWIAMGAQEQLDAVTEKNMRDFWAMEISGRFEAILLEALRG